MYNLEKKNQHYNKNTPGKCGRFKSIPNVHISIEKQKVVKASFFMLQYIITLQIHKGGTDKLVGTNITTFAMKRPLI